MPQPKSLPATKRMRAPLPLIDLAYFNYEHGGLIGATSRGDEFLGYDYTGLCVSWAKMTVGRTFS
jgi:hypothetical protein